MKKFLLILLLLPILALSACDGMFDDDYLSVAVHDEQYTLDEGSDALTAENFLGLKNAILSFVENHTEYGVIRIYNYDGDVEADLSDAAYEVSKTDPLGAYAVDYMTHDCTLIVSYYEIHIYITFARTLEEIRAVERVNSIASLKDAFGRALDQGQDSLVLRVSSYDELDYNALVRDYYTQNASRITELPQVSVELFPSGGVQRILRFSFEYQKDAQMRAQELELLTQTITELTQQLPDKEEERFEEISASILQRMQTLEVNESALLYDTLCGMSFNSESAAYAYCILSEEAGLRCIPVHGRRNNATYCWNIIFIGEQCYHVDLLRDLMQGSDSMSLYDDDAMLDEYTWDREAYPICESSPISNESEIIKDPALPQQLPDPPEQEEPTGQDSDAEQEEGGEATADPEQPLDDTSSESYDSEEPGETQLPEI